MLSFFALKKLETRRTGFGTGLGFRSMILLPNPEKFDHGGIFTGIQVPDNYSIPVPNSRKE